MPHRLTALAALVIAFCAVGAPAQAVESTDTPASAAPKPSADTKDPGKTATDAVTNPVVVPPAKGVDGSAVPPDGSGTSGQPIPGSTPSR